MLKRTPIGARRRCRSGWRPPNAWLRCRKQVLPPLPESGSPGPVPEAATVLIELPRGVPKASPSPRAPGPDRPHPGLPCPRSAEGSGTTGRDRRGHRLPVGRLLGNPPAAEGGDRRIVPGRADAGTCEGAGGFGRPRLTRSRQGLPQGPAPGGQPSAWSCWRRQGRPGGGSPDPAPRQTVPRVPNVRPGNRLPETRRPRSRSRTSPRPRLPRPRPPPPAPEAPVAPDTAPTPAPSGSAPRRFRPPPGNPWR
jgi:hypothetical protein